MGGGKETPGDALPLTRQEVTCEWLLGALGPKLSAEVTTVRLVETIDGTANKLIFELEPRPIQGPPSVCVKAGLDEETRKLVADGYIAEARFFSEVAPVLNAPLPRAWYAAAEPAVRQGIIVLDDLGALGCRFGDPLTGLTVEEVASGLQTLAAIHAATWNERGLEPFDWLGPQSSTVIDFYAACLVDSQWQASIERLTERQLPEKLRDQGRIEAALYATRTFNGNGPRVLAHGDAHIGNTYIQPDGTVAFLDWQTFSRGFWGDDVAYFMVGALSPEDRGASEWDLLDQYCEAMADGGVAREELGDVRAVYRRQHLHGLFWGLMPAGYQPEDRCVAMCEKYATAMLEHDTLGALGV